MIAADLRQGVHEFMTRRSLTLPLELKRAHRLREALATIDRRWPETRLSDSDDAHPVFLLSAGWRSGSTLLQRLICSSGEIVMWGEPLGESGAVAKLADSLTVFDKQWPPDPYVSSDLPLESFSSSWIANITPPIAALRQGHRALIDTWLAQPAMELYGQRLWGSKEVRLTIEHALYLKWLYPNARFVFIYRNLFDAYLSWRGNSWLSEWPGYYSYSPIAYARHWKLLLSGFLDGHREVDAMLIRYEDLIAGKVDLPKLAAHIGIQRIDAAVLEERIASPNDGKWRGKKRHLTLLEKAALKSIAGGLLKRLGYDT